MVFHGFWLVSMVSKVVSWFDLKQVRPSENVSVWCCEASFLSQNSRMGHFTEDGEYKQNVSLLSFTVT